MASNRKLKDSRFLKMDYSLIAKAVLVINAPPVVPLDFGLSLLSLPSVKITSHTLSEVTHGLTIVCCPENPPVTGILQRGFLKLSSSVGARGCSNEPVHSHPSPEMMDKGGVVSQLCRLCCWRWL